MASQQPQYEEEEKKSSGKIIILVIIAIWVILGIAGFIMSIVCFGRSGLFLKTSFLRIKR